MCKALFLVEFDIFMKQHLLGLDILRGICALSIAIYHVYFWSHDIEFTVISRYGVYIFFILSGFSINYQYANKIKNLDDIKLFIAKRFIRLFPLLFLVIISTHMMPMLKGNFSLSAFYSAIMTGTLLFGFGEPSLTASITGGWSLGIEFSFYILYPLILSICQSTRSYIVLTFILFLLKIIFAEYIVHSNTPYNGYWPIFYTNPLNFFFYFVIGCYFATIYPYLQKFVNSSYVYYSCLPLLFLFYLPTNMDFKNIVTGYLGILFTLLSGLIVLAYSLYSPRHFIEKKLAKILGDASYGLYLLHPLIWGALTKFGILPNHTILRCVVLLVPSLFISLILKKTFEDPVITFLKSKINYRHTGKKLSNA